jgi:uncharacterized repeat protein (TIGR02543 family)
LAVAGAALCAVVLGAHASAAPNRALHGSVTVRLLGAGQGRVKSTPPGIDCPGVCSAAFISIDDPGKAEPVVLTATPEAGSVFDGWGELCTGSGSCKIEPIRPGESYEVTASFSKVRPPSFPLTVSVIGSGRVTSAPPGIDCGQACSSSFATDSSVTLGATPFPGWAFVGWSGDCGGTEPCSVTMAGPRAVTATFAPPETSYALAVGVDGGVVTSSVEGISCGQACTASFGVGVSVTLQAQGSPVAWDGSCRPTGARCSLTMSGPRAVTAQIGGARPSRAPLAVAAAGKGSVVGAGGAIRCGSACGAVLALGARVRLTATPEKGWLFAGWRLGACSGVARTCTLAMTAARETTATFVEAGTRFPLGVTKAGRGRVTSRPAGVACGSRCSRSFPAGSAVTLDAAPSKGWKFVRWSGACSGRQSTCKLGMDGPKSVSAVFGYIADQKAPVVKALPSEGEPGRIARLRYRVSDASGKSREWASIFRGSKRLATVRGPLDAIDPDALYYFLPWRVPASLAPGLLRFCVVAVDSYGNRSRRSCAPLTIR